MDQGRETEALGPSGRGLTQNTSSPWGRGVGTYAQQLGVASSRPLCLHAGASTFGAMFI